MTKKFQNNLVVYEHSIWKADGIKQKPLMPDQSISILCRRKCIYLIFWPCCYRNLTKTCYIILIVLFLQQQDSQREILPTWMKGFTGMARHSQWRYIDALIKHLLLWLILKIDNWRCNESYMQQLRCSLQALGDNRDRCWEYGWAFEEENTLELEWFFMEIWMVSWECMFSNGK